MSAPREGFVHDTAVIGSPPEHRDCIGGQGFLLPVVDLTAQINAFVTVDGGLKMPTTIGARTFVMAHCHVGHDARIGADCELAPGTIIGGHAVLGDRVRCGIGVLVKPFVRVGDGARLGMGAVVIRDVPPGEVWAGNPARRINKPVADDQLTDAEVVGWQRFAEAVERNG